MCESTTACGAATTGATTARVGHYDAGGVGVRTGLEKKKLLNLGESCLLQERKVGPKSAGVYLISVGGEVEYVGSSRNLRRRLGRHRKSQRFPEDATVRWIPYAPDMESEMRSREAEIIFQLRPRMNMALNPDVMWWQENPVKLRELTCSRCGNTWRSVLHRPRSCPKCRARKWDSRSIYAQ